MLVLRSIHDLMATMNVLMHFVFIVLFCFSNPKLQIPMHVILMITHYRDRYIERYSHANKFLSGGGQNVEPAARTSGRAEAGLEVSD